MKALINILFAILMITPALAQEDDLPAGQDPKVRDKIQAARIAYITDQLKLTPDEAEKFWPVYREFAEKRKAIRLELKDMQAHPRPNQDPGAKR